MRLSVTVKEYTKKSLSLSEVALTPQSCIQFQVQDVWKGTKIGSDIVATIRSWLHHDAWCKHRRSPWLIENNGVSWGRKAAESSDSTWPSEVGVWSFVDEHLFRQKVVQWAWSFLDVTSGVREEVLRPHRGCYPPLYPPLPPPPSSLWPCHAKKHDWCIESKEILARVRSPSPEDRSHDFFSCGRPSTKFAGRYILPRAQRTWKRMIKPTCKEQQN